MAEPRIAFLTVGDETWASSRLRSYWPAKYLENAITVSWSDKAAVPMDCDAYVWMKTAQPEAAKELKARGAIQFVEVCDPTWWWEPEKTRAMVDTVDAVVAATQPAGKDFLEWYGDENKRVYIIPDRLELSHYAMRRTDYRTSDPVRFIWYGVAINRFALIGAVAYLDRLAANGVKFELTVFDNAPDQTFYISDQFPIAHQRWSLEGENQVIASHDVALLPPYPGPWGKIKTNNKTLTAWACGLPVTTGHDWNDLLGCATLSNYRFMKAQQGYEELTTNYDVRKTAHDWLEIIGQEQRIREVQRG